MDFAETCVGPRSHATPGGWKIIEERFWNTTSVAPKDNILDTSLPINFTYGECRLH